MRTERFRFKPFAGFRMKRNEVCDGSLVHSGAYGEGFVMSRICDTIQMIAEQSRQPTPGDRLLAAVRHWPGVAALTANASSFPPRPSRTGPWPRGVFALMAVFRSTSAASG
jgi:hypothetical protein